MTQHWTDRVLDFWFGELTQEQWFRKDAAVDAAIISRFMAIYQTVRAEPEAALAQTPRTALAAIIVLDQFPRNMFRDSPRAFESDAKALAVAERAIAAGHDAALSEDERHFLYMPFMHSEDIAHQERCVALFEALGKEQGIKYAKLHRDVIARFGRFPHRNAVLGRQTSAAEQAHLDEHGGF